MNGSPGPAGREQQEHVEHHRDGARMSGDPGPAGLPRWRRRTTRPLRRSSRA